MPKANTTQKEPIIYRVMIESKNGSMSAVEFSTKDEALNHVSAFTDKTVGWYGVYEINPKSSNLIYITHKRLIPFKDSIPVKTIEKKSSSKKKASTEKIKVPKNDKQDSVTSNEYEDVKPSRKRKVRENKSDNDNCTALKIESQDSNTEVKRTRRRKTAQQDANLVEKCDSTKKKRRRKTAE